MNRLVLVPCIVIACYVAAAYTASFVASYILLDLDRSRVGVKIPTFVSKGGDVSSRIKQASYPKKPVAIAEEPAAAVLAETSPSHESIWVTVLLLARLHTGPSVDAPISHFYAVSTPLLYAVSTPLRAKRFRNDWFELTEPNPRPQWLACCSKH